MIPLGMVTTIDIPLPHHLREKTVLQSTNRKLERKVKELSIQIDDERQHVNDQKDQVRTTATPSNSAASTYCVCLKAKIGSISQVFQT